MPLSLVFWLLLKSKINWFGCHQMPVLILLAGICAMVMPTRTNPPLQHPHCLEYGGCRYPSHPHPHVYHHYPHHSPFVPAPPGKTPSCAKHGQTFCEKVERYPM